MSIVAQIDSNDKPTWLAYNETTGGVESVYCDPITNALYIFGVASDANTPTALNRARIDANDYPTQLAYNDTTSLPEAMRCGTDGSLLAIIVS